MIYIVLPPELSKQTIEILIQYMYSGEVQVPNNILNEVLRGGELLKVRGLCRSSTLNEPSTIGFTPISKDRDNAQMFVEKPIWEFWPEYINGGNTSSIAVLKESTINVIPQQHLQTPKATVPQATSHHHADICQTLLRSTSLQHPTHNILVKKEVAIDPGEISALSLPPTIYAHTTTHTTIPSAAAKKQLPNDKRGKHIHENGRDVGGSSSSSVALNDLNVILNHHSRSQTQYQTTSRHFSEEQHLMDTDLIRLSTDKRRISIADHSRSSHHSDELLPQQAFVSKPKHRIDLQHQSTLQISEADFLTIKQEPIEWTDFDPDLEKTHIEVTIKPELIYTDPASDDDGKCI